MKKEMIILGVFLGIFVLLVGSVSAFAVSSKYWEEKPLEINAGETVEAFVILQNLNGEEDLMVQGIETSTDEGVEIKFTDESNVYDLPIGSKLQVNYSVTVPKEVSVGDLYMVYLNFKTMVDSGSGEFGFGAGVEREVPLLIVPKESKINPNWWIYLVAAIVLAGIILGIILRRRKK